MTRNEGGADRILRGVVGLAILGSGFYFHSWWGAVGLVPLLTAIVGWCPAYTLLGIKTGGQAKSG